MNEIIIRDIKDKDIAKTLGITSGSITNTKKKYPKMYALYRLGYENFKYRPEDEGWKNIKTRELSRYLGRCESGIVKMKNTNFAKYQILKRGLSVVKSNG